MKAFRERKDSILHNYANRKKILKGLRVSGGTEGFCVLNFNSKFELKLFLNHFRSRSCNLGFPQFF